MRFLTGVALFLAAVCAAVGAPPQTGLVVTFPIEGPIETEGLERAVKATLIDANRRNACAVLFEIDTLGGRVDVADAVAKQILAEKDRLTVAWIKGTGAVSAGAFIAYACDKVIAAPGAVAGASTPWMVSEEGVASPLEEKALSVVRSNFRSIAEATGRPGALAEAMVDASLEVWMVRRGGKVEFAASDLAMRMDSKDRVQVVVPAGKLLSASAETLLALGMADAVARDEAEVLKLVLDMVGAAPTAESPAALSRSSSGMGVLRTVQRQQEARDRAADQKVRRAVEEYRKQFRLVEQAMAKMAAYDPYNDTYRVNPETRRFADGGRKWRERTEQCLAHVNQCGKAVEALINMSRRFSGEENSEDAQRLIEFRRQLLDLRERLVKEKDNKFLPQ